MLYRIDTSEAHGTCKMFEHMYIVEQVYEVKTPYKITTRADSNHASNARKHKLVEASPTTNPEKGLAGKRKKIMQPIREIIQTVKKHACCRSPNTPWGSIKCLSNTTKSTLSSGPKKKPTPAATNIVVNP